MKLKNDTSLTFKDYLVTAMLMIVVGIMPLIVRLVMRPMPPELIPPGLEGEALLIASTNADVFTYWKGLFLIIPAIILSFFILSDLATSGKMPDFRSFFKRPPIIISLVYLFFVVLSAVFSDYTYTSWFGMIGRGEGVFIWLAYFIVFFAAAFFAEKIKIAKFIIYALAFSSIIMGLIGVSQFLGFDFFDTAFANWLVTLGSDGVTIGSVFTMAHGTLFNPNTFGKYTAMTAPILLLAALTYDGKIYVRLMLFFAGFLMLINVFGSSSLGGLIGIVTAALVLAVTFFCGAVYRKKQGNAINIFGYSGKQVLLSLGGLVAAIIIAIIFVPPLNYRVNFLFERLGVAMRAETTATHNYFFEDNIMTVYHGEERLLSLEVNSMATHDWLTVRDGTGNIVEFSSRDVQPVTYVFDIPGYRELTISRQQNTFAYHHRTPRPFFLTLMEGRIFGIDPVFWTLIDFDEKIPAIGFYGRETWGSNRGYIWSRTFPLMPRHIFLGSGSDTYMNVFPQHEIVAKQRFFNNPDIVVDKAHNLFLQTWIVTGGISAILLFGLFGHYLVTTFVSLVKSKDEQLFLYGLRLGLFTGVSAFVMSSMATDSTIGSSGVFFVLLGVGYGLNLLTLNVTKKATG